MRSGARSTSEVDKKVHREFPHWFRNRICNNLDNISGSDKNVLVSLAQGPSDKVRRFTAFNVNGFKFRTLARDNLLKTQNSGVFGMFGTRSYSSNSDAQMRFGGVPYYGRLIDIIEVSYDGFKVPILIHTGEHEDDEPYIKASEAQMVYYVDDEKEQGWSIPIHLKPRDLYDMGGDDEIMAPIEPYPSQNLEHIFSNETTHIQLARMTTDDDPETSTFNDDFDDNNHDMNL
uniref:Uncharacterized protein LOC113784735 n=1 Tax=Cicer arietinum TaxID=3827 RepID=A0A3Q7WYR6_CICAR|nr:uncharacterized protein LOC113784735 [Cicer arietinum]